MADIFDPAHWKERLRVARDRNQLNYALFHAPEEKFDAAAIRHKEILSRLIRPTDSVLDAGCAWGRLLDLLPKGWVGSYLGVDLSPDFIKLACERYPGRPFLLGDLRTLVADLGSKLVCKYHWAVCVAVKHMIIGAAGLEVWEQILEQLKGCAKRVLILTYDPDDEGEIL